MLLINFIVIINFLIISFIIKLYFFNYVTQLKNFIFPERMLALFSVKMNLLTKYFAEFLDKIQSLIIRINVFRIESESSENQLNT
jgi:hypothetical protein